MTRHQRTHPEYQESCWSCRISSVSVAGSPEVKAIDRSEKVLRLDLDSYRELRRQGLQPEHVKGSHDLARTATHPFEVEHNAVYNRFDDFGKAHVQEIVDFSGALVPAREAPESLKYAPPEPA